MADIPQKLGKYEIRRELGRGAMGIVYEGWDPLIARRVALKTIRKDQLEQEDVDHLLERFRREAQVAGRLNHPNVVAVYEYGEGADGVAFIAMEFVEGRDLKDYFDSQIDFPLAEVVRIMGELLDALAHAHAHGIVHRDVKPANIFLVKDKNVKFCDFGIARIESSNLTQVGSVLGSPAYMSPEQFLGQRVDSRSDLFSAGVILYQFLTGEKPFMGQLTTIMHKVLKEEPIAPSELNFQVPPVFDAVVRKAMAKRPDDRFQSAEEFAEALRKALAEAPAATAASAAQPAGNVNAEATMRISRDAAGTPRKVTQAAVSRSAGTNNGSSGGIPGWLVVIVVALLVAVGAAFYLYKARKVMPPPGVIPMTQPQPQQGSNAANEARRMVIKKMLDMNQQ